MSARWLPAWAVNWLPLTTSVSPVDSPVALPTRVTVVSAVASPAMCAWLLVTVAEVPPEALPERAAASLTAHAPCALLPTALPLIVRLPLLLIAPCVPSVPTVALPLTLPDWWDWVLATAAVPPVNVAPVSAAAFVTPAPVASAFTALPLMVSDSPDESGTLRPSRVVPAAALTLPAVCVWLLLTVAAVELSVLAACTAAALSPCVPSARACTAVMPKVGADAAACTLPCWWVCWLFTDVRAPVTVAPYCAAWLLPCEPIALASTALLLTV